MKGARIGELVAMAVIAILIAAGGKELLVALAHLKPFGALVPAGALVVAVLSLRGAYNPDDPAARSNVTRSGAYVVAAGFALWAVIAPNKWVFGTCIVAAEVAVVFDLIATAVRGRLAKGS
jgi:hypothetical protein